MFIWSLESNFCIKKKLLNLDYKAYDPWEYSSCHSNSSKSDFSIWEGHEERVIALGAISDMVVSMTKSREEQSILPSGYQLCQETDMIIYTEISSIFFSLLKNNILVAHKL